MTALAFSPDGRFLLAGGYGSVVVRSARDLKVVRTLRCDFPRIHDLAFSPDGRLLAVAGGAPGVSGGVRIWDWGTGRRVDAFATAADVATSVAFSPDGSSLACASADRSVTVWRRLERKGGVAQTRFRLSARLTGHAGPVLAVAFSPGGRQIISAGADRTLKVWETRSGRLLHSLSRHTGVVSCLALRPIGSAAAEAACASGSDDRTVRVWQPETGRMVRIVRSHEGAVLALVYSRDGRSLFSAGSEGILRQIDSDSDRILRQRQAHTGWIYSLAISPDGRRLALGDDAGGVRLWDAETLLPLSPTSGDPLAPL